MSKLKGQMKSKIQMTKAAADSNRWSEFRSQNSANEIATGFALARTMGVEVGEIAFEDCLSDLGQYFIPSENARYPGRIVLRKDKAAFSRVFVFN